MCKIAYRRIQWSYEPLAKATFADIQTWLCLSSRTPYHPDVPAGAGGPQNIIAVSSPHRYFVGSGSQNSNTSEHYGPPEWADASKYRAFSHRGRAGGPAYHEGIA